MEKDMIGAKLKSQKEASDKRLIKLENELKEAEEFKKNYPEGTEIKTKLEVALTDTTELERAIFSLRS
jgi:hypothetical protein